MTFHRLDISGKLDFVEHVVLGTSCSIKFSHEFLIGIALFSVALNFAGRN